MGNCQCQTGVHFMNNFSIVIQIRLEISLWSHPCCSEVIAMKFCTWHNSCAVMACAKFCSDMISYNGGTLKPIFHRIWITIEKLFMKWASVQPSSLWIYMGTCISQDNTLKPEQNGHYFADDIFKWKFHYFGSNFSEVGSWGSSC